jgi:hypothetical protein
MTRRMTCALDDQSRYITSSYRIDVKASITGSSKLTSMPNMDGKSNQVPILTHETIDQACRLNVDCCI